ncbi:MAG: hypothetical protein WBC22_16795 [Sedimentisphaerales bacterium]
MNEPTTQADNLGEADMKLLIIEDNKGIKHYWKFESDEEIIDSVASQYHDYKMFSNIYKSRDELTDDINQWLIAKSRSMLWGKSFIFETDKEGFYIAAYNSNQGVEVIKVFFVCDESQFTENKISQLNFEN